MTKEIANKLMIALFVRQKHVGVRSFPLYDEFNCRVKRFEDIALGTAILSVIAVPMLFIALCIKLTSKGPVLFKQRRGGKNGTAFEVYKFRSMSVVEDDMNIKQATKNDPRITPFGAFLRRTSLDELPQFFNVIKGDMSIVGPRPHALAHDEAYGQIITNYSIRHTVKPGITGWAQVNGLRGETDTLDKMVARVEHDLEYIRKWSLWLDVKIVMLTLSKKAHQNAK